MEVEARDRQNTNLNNILNYVGPPGYTENLQTIHEVYSGRPRQDAIAEATV